MKTGRYTEPSSGEIVSGYYQMFNQLDYYVDLARENSPWRTESYRDFEVTAMGVGVRHKSDDLENLMISS